MNSQSISLSIRGKSKHLHRAIQNNIFGKSLFFPILISAAEKELAGKGFFARPDGLETGTKSLVPELFGNKNLFPFPMILRLQHGFRPVPIQPCPCFRVLF